jgi:hypothetical protein
MMKWRERERVVVVYGVLWTFVGSLNAFLNALSTNSVVFQKSKIKRFTPIYPKK